MIRAFYLKFSKILRNSLLRTHRGWAMNVSVIYSYYETVHVFLCYYASAEVKYYHGIKLCPIFVTGEPI